MDQGYVPTLTLSQRRAVHWLRERGGSGVIDNYGRVLAAGELNTHSAPETWLRLVAYGLLRGGEGRLELVEEERDVKATDR